MKYTVKPDLSITFSDENGNVANYPDYNTHTMTKFNNKAQAEQYAESIMGSVKLFVAPVKEIILSPIALKMLFTSQERVALKKSTDEIVKDMLEMVNDPRLRLVTMSHITDMINYLETTGLIGEGRAAEILAG